MVATVTQARYMQVMTIPPLSLLDLCSIVEGGGAGEALRASRRLAGHAERLGYRRFWMAEHHNSGGVASAATAVALAFVAEGTSTIRIGSGGVMLPNWAPLQVAEQFGTLAALHPGRVDLGVGRAPGTDALTARALRRTLGAEVDRFPNDVVELIGYFGPPHPDQRVRAIPGEGEEVPVWMLGSSTYGAQLAAMLGLPFAFASHFGQQQMPAAIAAYRGQFRPSRFLDKPYLMLGLSVIAADTDAEAELIATSQHEGFIELFTGNPGKLPPPDAGLERRLTAERLPILRDLQSRTVVGSQDTVRAQMADFAARTAADEIIVTAQIYDEAARMRSFELIGELIGDGGTAARPKAGAVAAP